MESLSVIGEKCLLVKEKWGFGVDTPAGVLITSSLSVAGREPLHLGVVINEAGVCPAAWWYWRTSEEAIALA